MIRSEQPVFWSYSLRLFCPEKRARHRQPVRAILIIVCGSAAHPSAAALPDAVGRKKVAGGIRSNARTVKAVQHQYDCRTGPSTIYSSSGSLISPRYSGVDSIRISMQRDCLQRTGTRAESNVQFVLGTFLLVPICDVTVKRGTYAGC